MKIADCCFTSVNRWCQCFSFTQDADSRVFILAMYAIHARQLICQVCMYIHVHVTYNHISVCNKFDPPLFKEI